MTREEAKRHVDICNPEHILGLDITIDDQRNAYVKALMHASKNCEALGGKLQSRQVIASIITNTHFIMKLIKAL
jgi:hypothetical protein